MNTYACLSKNTFQLHDYKIIPIREEDIFDIKDWRNAQITVLRQKYLLTDQAQKDYYNNIIKPLFTQHYPEQILFTFLHKCTRIGYGGIVHISWEDERGEVSFLVNPERTQDSSQYRKDFTAYLSLIKYVSFEILDINRLYTETYDSRPLHIKILEDNGFVREGIMRQHVIKNGNRIDSIIHGCLKQDYELQTHIY